MARTVATGYENFAEIRQKHYFYVDKTRFIKDWWNGGDFVTLITRPRRFGKTLMLDTVRTFFSHEFAGRSELFEGLEIWKEETFRSLQGTVPVIFLSFADIKERHYEETITAIKELLTSTYRHFARQSATFSDWEKKIFSSVHEEMSDVTAKRSVRNLAECLAYQYKNKPIILLDEYDTPLQEAWIHGYWDELVCFMRGFFNSTFKTNPYLERGLISGITRISKESIFSDLNNLNVVTTTSTVYSDCFGFTEGEVFSAMDEYGLTEKEKVKEWYDGFIFGSQKNIYNPWSIIKFLSVRKFDSYWANTSSNTLISKIIGQSDEEIKEKFSILLNGEAITVQFDEEIVFSQLYDEKGAIWNK